MLRLLLTCLLSCPSAALYAAPPSKVQASYEVLKGGITVATMTETYTRVQNRYTLESVSQAVGLLALFKPETIRVASEGSITPSGLRPSTFVSTRKLDSDRNARADFDWEHGRITLTERAGKRTLPLAAGTQDRLSAMYQFMFLPLQGMSELKFDMTNGTKLDHYSYELAGGKSVTTPLGTFKAIYAASPVEPGSASRTEIWLAVEHANFPYKVVITDSDGSKFTQVLTKVDFVP